MNAISWHEERCDNGTDCIDKYNIPYLCQKYNMPLVLFILFIELGVAQAFENYVILFYLYTEIKS